MVDDVEDGRRDQGLSGVQKDSIEWLWASGRCVSAKLSVLGATSNFLRRASRIPSLLRNLISDIGPTSIPEIRQSGNVGAHASMWCSMWYVDVTRYSESS